MRRQTAVIMSPFDRLRANGIEFVEFLEFIESVQFGAGERGALRRAAFGKLRTGP